MSLARTFTESEHTVVTLAGRDGKLETQFKLATCYVHRVLGKLGYHSLPPLRINMPCRAEELITVVYFQLCAKKHFQIMDLLSQEYLIFEIGFSENIFFSSS